MHNCAHRTANTSHKAGEEKKGKGEKKRRGKKKRKKKKRHPAYEPNRRQAYIQYRYIVTSITKVEGRGCELSASAAGTGGEEKIVKK